VAHGIPVKNGEALTEAEKNMQKSIVRIGMIGTGVMAKAHSIAYSVVPFIFPSHFEIEKTVIADLNEELASAGAKNLGFEKWSGNWEEVVNMAEVDVIDICTPNDLHLPIAIAAAEKDKHLICEKPLALNLEQTRKMHQKAQEKGVRHSVAFNYRMTPAVLEAKRIIESGLLGDMYHFRGIYLQDFAIDENFPLVWRFQSSRAGSGALGDIGSHIIDYARFLVGEPFELVAMSKTFIPERPIEQAEGGYEKLHPVMGKVDVDDAVSVLMKFENGAVGTIEASRFSYGRKNHLAFEISGSKGSLYFDWEQRNELLFYSSEHPKEHQGFTTIITGPEHPYGGILWPIPGLGMSYIETTIILIHEFLSSLFEEKASVPDFYDGLRVEEIMDAIQESAKVKKWVKVKETCFDF
jgi:predicted dehydrogenase